MTVTTHPSAHDLTNCHDVRHNGPGCPSCDGVKITCRTHKAPSGSHAALASGPEERTQGGGGSRTSPHGSPRPSVVPNSIDVHLPAAGTAGCRGEWFQVVKVKWSAWASHVDGRVIVSVTAFGADPMQNVTWDANEAEPPPGWATPAPEWFHAGVEQMRSLEPPSPQEDEDDYYDVEDDLAYGGSGGSIGPGNAGSYYHDCGYHLSWPEDTTGEEKAAMYRLIESHELECAGDTPTDSGAPAVPSPLTEVVELLRDVRDESRSRRTIGYFKRTDRLGGRGSLSSGKGRDVEGDVGLERVDEDGVLARAGRLAADLDLSADRPVHDHVPPVAVDAHDPSLVDAPSDEIGSRLQGLGFDADDDAQVRDPGPEGLHAESVPEPITDTPDVPPDDSGEWTRVDHGAAWVGEGEQIPIDSTTWLNRRTGERRSA